MREAHRLEVEILVAAANEDVPGIKDDEVVEIGCPCAGIGGGAVQCIRQHSAAVAEVSRAEPRFERDGVRREVLRRTGSVTVLKSDEWLGVQDRK